MDDVPFKSTIDWMVIFKLVLAIVALINFWCPYMEKINEWIFAVKDEELDEEEYESARFEFTSDYARENPATKETAT